MKSIYVTIPRVAIATWLIIVGSLAFPGTTRYEAWDPGLPPLSTSVSGSTTNWSLNTSVRRPAVSHSKWMFELAGQIGGRIGAVAIDGDLVYAAIGTRLVVLHSSYGKGMLLLGDTGDMGDTIKDVDVLGKYAFVAFHWNGLGIIDVSNPEFPIEIARLKVSSSIGAAIAAAGELVYFAEWRSLHIVDVSNPTLPRRVGSCELPGRSEAVAISGSFAYVASRDGGLQIIDVAVPKVPRIVGTYHTLEMANDVKVRGRYAYVTDHGRGLRIIDIFDPTSPKEVGSLIPSVVTLEAVVLYEEYAYLANGAHGLLIVDISEPTNPVEIGRRDISGSVFGVGVTDAKALLTTSVGLVSLDIMNAGEPSEIDRYRTMGALDVTVWNQLALVACGAGGMHIVDISDPWNPISITYYDIASYDICLLDQHAYVASGDAGLHIIDMSDPTTPMLVSQLDTPGSAEALVLHGRHAYVADRRSGLRIIDVSNPANPTTVGVFDTPGTASGVAVAERYAYVADGNQGLRIINVSDVSSPVEVGSHKLPMAAVDVIVVGRYAYVTDVMSGLHILDISDPTFPITTGTLNTPTAAMRLAVVGSHAYVADSVWLVIINVADPHAPYEVARILRSGSPSGVTIEDDFIYVAERTTGLVIFRATHSRSLFLPLAANRLSAHQPPNLTPTPTATPQPRELPAHDDGAREVWAGGTQGSVMAVRYPISPLARVHSARFFLGGEMRPMRFIVWNGAWQELYSQTLTPNAPSGGGWWTWTLPAGVMGPQSEVYVGYQCLSDYSGSGPWVGYDTSQPKGETYAGPWPPQRRTDGNAMVRVLVQH